MLAVLRISPMLLKIIKAPQRTFLHMFSLFTMFEIKINF